MSLTRLTATILVTLVLCLASARPAAAASISFSFNCNIAGPSCSAIAPVGTLTISDSVANSNWVDISLSLAGGDPQSFYFNFTGFPLPAGFSFRATGTTVDVDENDLQADGYNIGEFDLAIPDTGNITGNPFTTVLRLSNANDSIYANLDALMFAAQSDNNVLWAAVNRTTGNSWFGSTLCVGCPGQQTPVPEPATVLLLGAGLVGGAARMRRRNRVTRT